MTIETLVEELRARAESCDLSGPSAKHTADLLRDAADALTAKDTALSDRDRTIEYLGERILQISGYWQEQTDRATAAEAENAALREALEPFEELADEGNDDQPDDTKVIVHAGRSIIYTLRLSDLRRARSASRALAKGERHG